MTHPRLNRRTLLKGAAAVAGVLAVGMAPRGSAQSNLVTPMTPPIGWAGEAPGDGFQIGHGFACENTWFSPGWWHTGEDWYAVDRDTGDAVIYAITAGEVVYVGFDYPGRVVIVRHAVDLYSVYGHLNIDTPVREGQQVSAGEAIGSVLLQTAGRAPSHLHFEARTFLTTTRVNGGSPSYGVNCGVNCPPGPGYWPIKAPEHPVELGWRNPTHQQVRLALDAGLPDGSVARVQSAADGREIDVHVDPDGGSPILRQLSLAAGDAFTLLDLSGDDPTATGTSAESYDVWLKIRIDDGTEAWVQGAIPSTRETGSDGKPSALDRPFLILPGG